ncbi:Glycosyl transferase family 2 [Amphibacillus marinus]|uniref:Glycosyl transferase family 2 n=1 Tax=Amphibacillus marinus TaxID=872970 RepID=A0A1H8N7D5_9BACI|nr:glycosyltransferase [Amphibacillus marinus]SEO25389.1 Glycosyl transferase family 2 [Amphibacillus marinus]
MKLGIFCFFYNRESEVNNCVQSLLDAAPVNCKIILVDDGSSDGTRSRLKQFIDSRVVILTQKNKGFTKSLSELIPNMIRKYSFEYISIHGSGDLCNEKKFLKQLDYLEDNREVVALGTGHETISGYSRKTIRLDKGYLQVEKESLLGGVPFTHGTVMYRSDSFLKAGGYDDRFLFCQDWELYFRLLEIGQIRRLPDVLYSKFIFEDGASFKPRKKVMQLKYRALIKSRELSDEDFYNNLDRLEKKDIKILYPDKIFLGKFKRLRKDLILKGEFNLAAEWCEIINETTGRKGKALKKYLLFIHSIRLPGLVLPAVYKRLRLFKRRLKL